jgi:hypothetical protein
MPLPKKGVAYTFNRSVVSSATPGSLQTNPTIAVGDWQISKDGGAFVNLTNTPTVVPAGSVQIQFVLTVPEMTADRVSILGIDLAGAQWGDFYESFDTTVQTIDDVPTADVNADTLLKRDWTSIAGDPPAYSVWNALRFLRNVWALVSGAPAVLHVKKEDGTTDAWTRNVSTDTSAQPVTGVN